jgi:hypothetical protein
LVQVATIQIPVDDVVDHGTPEAVLSLVFVVPHPFEFLEVVFDAGIEI